MGELEVIRLFKCLADRSRLQILRSLLSEDMYVERLAQRLDLTPATISFHMKKLEEAGAVRSYKDQYYTMFSINREVFQGNVLDLIRAASDEEKEQAQRDAAYRQKVIEAFFEYGRLKAIPAQRKKERICLEELAKSFEPGRVYEEAEVNEILSDFHEDYCTLRRDMISEKLMEREDGRYVRTTGR